MASLRPWAVVRPLDHAGLALVFELVRVLVHGHVVVGLGVWHLTEVAVRLQRLLLGAVALLGLRVGVGDARVPHLVRGVLRGVDLLAVVLVWVPDDVRVVGTMVVAVGRVLELADHILLVRCSVSWSHVRLVVRREVAVVLLRSLLLHNVILGHVHGRHRIRALIEDLV